MEKSVEEAAGLASDEVRTSSTFQMLLLTVVVTAGAYARVAISPLQETMRLVLPLTDNEIALLQGPALAVPLLLVSVPLGLLIDRYSRVRLILILAALDVVGSIGTALASDFAVLFTARSLVGLTTLAVNPAAFSLLADLYAPVHRGRATMVLAVGQFAGYAAAFAVGGFLLTSYASDANGWRWAMAWLTAPLVLVALVALGMREPVRTGLAIKNPSIRDAWQELWRYRAVIGTLLAGLVLIEVAIGAVVIWAVPALSRTFAVPADRMGAIMATGLIVSGTVGPIAAGPLTDFCNRAGGPRLTLWVLGALSLLGALATLFPLAPAIGLASVLLVAFMTLVGAMVVMTMTLFTVAVPNELRGLCMSVAAAACVFFGTGLAPLTVSLLSTAMGGNAIGQALAIVCTVAGILCASLFAFGARFFPRTAVQ